MNDRALIKAALKYKSGEDSINTVYMGSLATHSVYMLLGINVVSAKAGDFEKAVDNASSEVIARVKERCQGVIDYMIDHPIKRCESCGQIVRI